MGRPLFFSRLKTGHRDLGASMKRLGVVGSALCDCKEAQQTVYLILKDCCLWLQPEVPVWMRQPSTSCWKLHKACANHPVPGSMWTEALSGADRPKKKLPYMPEIFQGHVYSSSHMYSSSRARVCLYMCNCVCVSVCVRACLRARASARVCLCVCDRARARAYVYLCV